MVYLLSIISDYSRGQVYSAIGSDVAMIMFGIIGTLSRDRIISGKWGDLLHNTHTSTHTHTSFEGSHGFAADAIWYGWHSSRCLK